MPRALWQDPYAADSIALMRDPARARAYAVEKIGEARARSQEIAGQALAASQLQTGNAMANAEQQGGQAWAGAINQIGQTVAAIPGQIQQQKIQGLQQQNLQSEIANRKAQEQQRLAGQKANAAVDAIMQQSLKQDPTTGVYSFDRPTFEQGLVQSGNGHLYPELAETLDKLDLSASKRNTEARGMLADTLMAIGKSGYTPEAVFSGAAYLKANQVIKNDQLEPVLAAIAVDPSPDNIKAVVMKLGGALPEYGKRLDAEEQRATALAKTKAEADKIAADARMAAAEATNLETLGRKEKPQEKETRSLDVQAADALAKGDLETYTRLLKVKKEMGQADDRPRININTGPNVNVPGDWDKSGKDFLATVPAQWRKTVEKIANYDEDPTKVASMRSGMRETLMQWVNQVNPGYDASQFSLRAPTRKAFTTGTQGQQINAINTALGHIDQLDTLVQQLGNGSFTPGNKAWNAVRTIFGSDKVTNFDTLKDALSGEVASVLSKSGATVAGIKDAQEKISAANSPAQLMGYVKTQIPIMGSKLAALDDQYKQAMGPNDAFQALSANSKAILTRMGFNPAHPDLGQSAAPIKLLRYNPATGKVE